MIVLQYFSLSHCVCMQNVRNVGVCCQLLMYTATNLYFPGFPGSREIVHPGTEFPGSTRAGHTTTLVFGLLAAFKYDNVHSWTTQLHDVATARCCRGLPGMHIVASAKRVHMIFKQKQRLGCIYDSEIQAYLGSGIKKIDSDSFWEKIGAWEAFFLLFF